jgi:hypothetical protein
MTLRLAALLCLLLLAGCAHPPRGDGGRSGDADARSALQPPPRKRPDSPGERAELHLARRLPAGMVELDPRMYARAEQQAAALPQFDSKRGRHVGKQAAGGWEWMGPANVAGRMRALVFDPRNPSRMLAGGVSGGVWESLDSGGSWRALSDDAVNINIGALAFDPVEPDTIYAGTGELYRNSLRPYAAMWGRGILRSTDGGQSWPQLLATRGDDFRYVSDIVVSPHDHRRLYAATNTGVWRSDDRGRRFVQVLRPTAADGTLLYEGCTELQLVPGHAGDHLLATCASRSTDDRYYLPGTLLPPSCVGPCPASVFLSTDAAAAAPLFELVLSEPGMGRTELALAPSDPAVIYAVSASTVPGPDRNGDAIGDYDNGLHAVFRSLDGGRSWEARVRNSSPDRLSTYLLSYGYGFEPEACRQGAFRYGAGWYNMAIAVNPLDPEMLWVGGMELYRSDDGGRSFGKASEWWPKDSAHYLHADAHVLAFHPDYGRGNDTLYVGNDGGFAATGNDRGPLRRGPQATCLGSGAPTPGWQERVTGLGTTQYYTGVSNADGSLLIGGLQDNGTLLWRDSHAAQGWLPILGGDGATAQIDPRNDNVIYASSQNVSLRRSVDGGRTFQAATNGLNDTPIFIMPYVIDHSRPDRLWAGGTRLWRTDDQGRQWQPASAVLGAGFDHRISAVDVSALDGRWVVFGNRIGIHRLDSQTAGASAMPQRVSPRSGWVSSLRFAPGHAERVYATYSTFGGDHVWRSDDAGASWTPIDGSGAGRLPDVPVHDIAIDPGDGRRLYVGTDIGVFVSLDGGASWAREKTGFASVIVERLAVAPDAEPGPLLHAFTYGRGVWRVPLAELSGAPVRVIDGDLAGTFYDPAQDGHGWVIEPIAVDGVLGVVASWYTFRDGRPIWLIGIGVADEERVRVPLQITDGTGFPPDFDPAAVQRRDWGTAEFRFDDADRGTVSWSSDDPAFADGSMPLQRLILPATADGSDGSEGLVGCHSGTWYQPAEDGHGLQVQLFGSAEARQLMVVWYVYQHGEQRWLIGTGPVDGDHAVVDLISADGADFPPAFDPGAVERRPWGQLRFTALGADRARIEWTSVQEGYPGGARDLQRLSAMVGRECAG